MAMSAALDETLPTDLLNQIQVAATSRPVGIHGDTHVQLVAGTVASLLKAVDYETAPEWARAAEKQRFENDLKLLGLSGKTPAEIKSAFASADDDNNILPIFGNIATVKNYFGRNRSAYTENQQANESSEIKAMEARRLRHDRELKQRHTPNWVIDHIGEETIKASVSGLDGHATRQQPLLSSGKKAEQAKIRLSNVTAERNNLEATKQRLAQEIEDLRGAPTP
jgi:hypothetical protein